MKECPDIRFDRREASRNLKNIVACNTDKQLFQTDKPSLATVLGRPEHVKATKTKEPSRGEPDEAHRSSRRATPASGQRVSAYQVMTEAS